MDIKCFCISAAVPSKYWSNPIVKEIVFHCKDKFIDDIIDAAYDFPDKTIVVSIESIRLMSKNAVFSDCAKMGNIKIAIDRLDDEFTSYLDELGLKWFVNFPLNSYYLVNAMINTGTSDICITEPVTFNINLVKNLTNSIRVNPIMGEILYSLLDKNHIYGTQYIRPEDIKYYAENGIDIFDISNETPKRQIALLEIYEHEEWNGKFKQLFPHFDDIEVSNSAFPSSFGRIRANCRQKCMHDGCHYCNTVFETADKVYNFYHKEV